MVYRQVKELEAAGAIAAEIEVVPEKVASEIARRTSLLLLSMGAGAGCDAQYLFAEDVLGYTRGHQPAPREGLPEFSSRVRSPAAGADRCLSGIHRRCAECGAFPEEKHLVPISDEEFERFSRMLSG